MMLGRAPISSRGAALTVALVAAVLLPIPGRSAEPERGTIRWGGSVEWSGGPLTGSDANLVETRDCTPGGCDEFLLNIRVPRSPDPEHRRYVEIALDVSEPDLIDLVVIPPRADLSRDWTDYVVDAARLLDPRPGVWRIQARCFERCVGVTYTGRATTGEVRVPQAVAHRPGAVRIRSRRAVTDAPAVRLHQVQANAFEPTLGVTANGSVFYQGWFGNPKVLRSDNEGKTWNNVSPSLGALPRHPVSSDPILHVDEDTSRVFTVDLLYVRPVCLEVSFTDDEADSWTTTVHCQHNPDHPTLFTGPPATSPTIGYPNVVYWCANGYGTLATVCSKSLDGGITFVPTGAAAFHDPAPGAGDPDANNCGGQTGLGGGLTGPGVVGRDGTVYLPRGWCDQPFLAISRDEGLTWERVQVADNGVPADPVFGYAHETGVAVDRRGTLYYVWLGFDRLPYLSTSRDGGRTWSKPMMIGLPGLKEAALPAIDVGALGRVVVAYMGSENSPGAPFETCTFNEDPVGYIGGCAQPGGYTEVTWNGYMTMTTSALTREPLFYTAPVNDPADPLVVGICAPTRCEGAGDFFDVVVAPDGTPWAAFTDACVVDRCTNFPTGGGEGIVGRLVGGPPLV